jgi:hypothetical protein
MNSVPAAIAAFALAVPASQARAPLPAPVAHEVAVQPAQDQLSGERAAPAPFRAFRHSYEPEAQNQVHIEQRVIIRIAPGPPDAREDLLAQLPRPAKPARYKEKKLKGCIPIEGIAGSQPDDNRLLLFMRDHRVLSAALERACDPADYYLGFYIEQNADGMLCSKRDKLHARTGATCEVAQLSRIVAIKD